MAINILMLGWELPPYNSGGLGTACLGLTEGLAGKGVKVKFVVPKVFGKVPYNHMEVIGATDYAKDDEIKRLLESESFEQEWIAYQLAYGNRIKINDKKDLLVEFLKQKLPISPHVQATWYSYQAAAIARANPNFDVVHSHDWFTYYGGMAARQVAESQGRVAPLVTHIHATEVDRCGEHCGDPRILKIEKVGLNAADRVVAVSHYTKEVVHKYYGVPREKISVVHNGIPLHKTPKKFDLHELKKHHKIVLFMGRITMQKGPEYFIQLAKAVTDVDPSVRFIMVGSGDMEHRCIELSAKLGLTGKLLFNPFARGEEVDHAYQMADLFVMPSVSEPFGLVALEAIQNGTPCLSSRQAGVIEVTGNIMHENFWDIEAMKKAVLYALHNPGPARKMMEDCQQELPNLTWNQAAEKMRRVYQEVIADAGAKPLAPSLALAA